MIGKLSDKTDGSILIDTGTSKSYMSKSFLYEKQDTPCITKVCTNYS